MAERRGVKRDCSFLSVETPLGTTHLLRRDCGDDHPFEILHIKGLLINKPGIMVAAVGGIPDELKIKDGISYSFPSPVYKIPKNLPQDPIQRHMAVHGAMEECLVENDVCNVHRRAYAKALGIRKQSEEEEEEEARNMNNILTPTLLQVICKQFEEGEDLHSINQLPPTMIEVNLPAPLPPPPPLVYPIPTSKQAVREENKSVKNNSYILHTDETCFGTRQYLQRDCGDGTIERIILKEVLVKKSVGVLAVGGVPDELRIKGGKSFSFWFPCPILKYPKDRPEDPTENDKVWYEVHKEGLLKCNCKRAFVQAYYKALRIRFSESAELAEMEKAMEKVMEMEMEKEEEEEKEKEKEKAHNIDQGHLSMMEINLAGPILHKDQINRLMKWIFF